MAQMPARCQRICHFPDNLRTTIRIIQSVLKILEDLLVPWEWPLVVVEYDGCVAKQRKHIILDKASISLFKSPHYSSVVMTGQLHSLNG